jgi:hypothetical protein
MVRSKRNCCYRVAIEDIHGRQLAEYRLNINTFGKVSVSAPATLRYLRQNNPPRGEGTLAELGSAFHREVFELAFQLRCRTRGSQPDAALRGMARPNGDFRSGLTSREKVVTQGGTRVVSIIGAIRLASVTFRTCSLAKRIERQARQGEPWRALLRLEETSRLLKKALAT